MEIETRAIILGEKTYTVKALPHKRSKAWRRRLAEEMKPLFEQVGSVKTAEWSRPSDLLPLWPVVESLVVDAIDAVFELVIMASPQLEAERELIEDTATDRQIMVAFGELVALIDPFGISRQIAAGNGRTLIKMMTSSSSPSLNGDSPSSVPSSSPSDKPSDSSVPTPEESAGKPS